MGPMSVEDVVVVDGGVVVTSCGGVKVNVSPPVVSVVGEETVGSVIGGLVPMITTPELEMTVCPSGRVHVVATGDDVIVDVVTPKEGVRVNVSPPVVSVVGVVTVGRVIGVLVPMITTPELEITVCPSDRVHVVAMGDDVMLVPPDGGVSVNVSPPVVRVVGVVTVGKVIGVFVPIMTTPELEITVSPSGRVHVVATGDDV